MLPVIDNEAGSLSRVTVADVMQHDVVTVHPETPLNEVARLMWDEKIGGVPVLDAQRRPVGFISASDIVRCQAFGRTYQPPGGETAVAVKPQPPRPLIARDVMTPVTLSVRAGATLPELARFLVRAGIHHALVIERGRLVGVVSTWDVVQHIAESFAGAEDEAEPPLRQSDDEIEC